MESPLACLLQPKTTTKKEQCLYRHLPTIRSLNMTRSTAELHQHPMRYRTHLNSNYNTRRIQHHLHRQRLTQRTMPLPSIHVRSTQIYLYSIRCPDTLPLSVLLSIDTANPDDPNELSFHKGEVLEILDRRGNWWQARKQDQTIGIVPSNYVSTAAPMDK